jgi:glycine betaine transporter
MKFTNLLEGLDDIDEFVFGGSVLIFTAFVITLLVAPEAIRTVLSRASSMFFIWHGLFYQLIVVIAVGVVLTVLITPLGSHKLGGPSATPEFGGSTYFAILFSAAIAAGIVFSGPAEALIHFTDVPPTVDAQPESAEAASVAFQYTLFHWGVSVWSIYLSSGILIAYFTYSHGAPLRFSAVLTPLLGAEHLDSYPAKAVDLLGVVAPLVGTTATIARVSQQFISGIEHRWTVTLGRIAVVIFMLGVVVVFTVSAIAGIRRGIRRLSILNTGGFVILGILVFALGPTEYVVGASGDAVVRYAAEFGAMSTETGTGWVRNWTLFYWVWWFSWAPFVGLFVARISRGRTLRSLVLYGVGATSVATTAWFLTLGATSIQFVQSGRTTISGTQDFAGFRMFAALPGGDFLIFVFLALIITFLVTSADSLILTVGYQTTKLGTIPSITLRATWGGLLAGLTTAILLVSSSEIVTAFIEVVGSLVAVVFLIAIAATLYELDPFVRIRRRIGR